MGYPGHVARVGHPGWRGRQQEERAKADREAQRCRLLVATEHIPPPVPGKDGNHMGDDEERRMEKPQHDVSGHDLIGIEQMPLQHGGRQTSPEQPPLDIARQPLIDDPELGVIRIRADNVEPGPDCRVHGRGDQSRPDRGNQRQRRSIDRRAPKKRAVSLACPEIDRERGTEESGRQEKPGANARGQRVLVVARTGVSRDDETDGRHGPVVPRKTPPSPRRRTGYP